MWLINTESLELKQFHREITPYAILSHVWVDREEVSFREFIDMGPSTKTKSGYRKIRNACNIAKLDGIDWMWIDTNCIDKSSSAELTEAINSMFNWYRHSTACYAYLDDVPHLDWSQPVETLLYFRQSHWFLRGWTLQEMIAPPRLEFYSQQWRKIGDRNDLAGQISVITGIETPLLHASTEDLQQVSVAKKMSWAARTTRVEDIAYCLLGIFDVNIPLLYGEGPKAFMRLQEEIIKSCNDHTIFCWSRNGSVPAEWTSMLAPSPAAFLDAGHYMPVHAWDVPMPCSMTNLGVSISLPVIYTLTQLFVVLDAEIALEGARTRACIAVQRTNPRRSGSHILDRSRFLNGPVMLSKKATDTRERYRLYIWSRHLLRPGTFHWPHWRSPGFNHGVLLFVDRTATRLLSPGRMGVPLGSVGYKIVTHPPEIFDEHTALLRLWEGSEFMASGLMRISFTSPQEPDIYLFFAVTMTLSGKEVWYCGVHVAEEVSYIKQALKESVAEGRPGVKEGGLPKEDALIHGYFREEAWMKSCHQLTARTADESLFVSIGGTMALRPGADVRAAMLSGKCESPSSVPVSATDLHHVAYEENGDDYMDDSGEERQVWVSDEEREEEENDSADEGRESMENGPPGWDASFRQSSQIFSSRMLSSAS